ncbi:MAG: AraC family transcriptional regulator [Verrucomicrobiae bacterium]|nr:AraC family transcriptional regulator [Verrucomicrobiae bacterium]
MTRYPWKLLPRLASEVEHGQKGLAHKDLEELLDIIVVDGGSDLSFCKLRCAQLISGCLRGAHRGGASSDRILSEHLRTLKELAALRTWSGVKAKMHRYLDRLLGQVEPKHRSLMERIVGELRADLRTTEGMKRSLAYHAALHRVSVGHLSRSFNAIAGRSFREELRTVRMETASRLLAGTDLKVSVIAGRVGLRDPSQFIADFRAEFGVTPGTYRTGQRRDTH